MIRTAQPADISEIKNLFRNTIQNVNCKDYDVEQVKAWSARADLADWAYKIDTQYFTVAIVDHKIVGFASLEHHSHIDLLFVHQHHQGRGIAQKLLTDIEERAIWPITTDASITAKPFFEKQGYQVIRQQTVYIGGTALTNFKMVKG